MIRLHEIAKKHLPHVPERWINSGHCYVWAWIVAAHIPQCTLWSDTKRDASSSGRVIALHAFPRIGNLFFDSEVPHGVPALNYIPLFQFHDGIEKKCEKHTPQSFFEHWERGEGIFSNKLRKTLRENRKDVAFVNTIKRFNAKHKIVMK